MSNKDRIEAFLNDKDLRIILGSSFVSGILAHGMAAFNKFAFHDELYSMYGYNLEGTYQSGRWAAELLEYFYRFIYRGPNYSLSTFSFFCAILYSSLMIWMVVKAVKIESSIAIGLLAALNVAYPVFVSMMGYNFTVPFTYFGYLLGTTSVYLFLVNTNKIKTVIGIMLGVFSIALYQAVLPYMLTFLLIIILANTFADHYPEWKDFIIEVVKSIFYFIIIVVVYYVSVKLSLIIHSAKLHKYRNIDSFGLTSIKGYLERIANSYIYFIWPQGPSASVFPGIMQVIRLLIVLSIFALILIIACNLWKRGKHFAALESILIMFCFPLAYNFIIIMIEPSDVHALMLYSQFFIFVLLMLLIYKAAEYLPNQIYMVEKLAVLVLLASSILYIRFDNICYTKTEIALEDAKAYFIELKTRIESAEGYSAEKQVLFLNDLDKNTDNLYHMEEFAGTSVVPYGELNGGNYVNDTKWKTFMKYWTGYDPVIYVGEDLSNDSRVYCLPHYPDYGSIVVLDDVVVVNF